MTRKRELEDDYKAFKLDGTLEQRVKAWSKFADFRHLSGSPCSVCGKAKYYFTPEDTEGFCTECFNKRWIPAKHKRGWSGVGANAHKKQKGKNVNEGEDQKQ